MRRPKKELFANLKYVCSFLLILLQSFQDGTLAATTHRHKKLDPKYEKAVLDALGMKKPPQNDNR